MNGLLVNSNNANNAMGLVFNREHAIFHHQRAQIVDILIKQRNLNMCRLNPNALPCELQIAIEEENELKKKQKNTEKIKQQQYSVINNIEAAENGWKCPSRKVHQRNSFPPNATATCASANQCEVLSELEEENINNIRHAKSQTKETPHKNCIKNNNKQCKADEVCLEEIDTLIKKHKDDADDVKSEDIEEIIE